VGYPSCEVSLVKCLKYKGKIVQFEIMRSNIETDRLSHFYPLKFGVLLVANFRAIWGYGWSCVVIMDMAVQ